LLHAGFRGGPTILVAPYEIRGLARGRIALVLTLVLLPRAAVSTVLFYAGAKFLIFTPSLDDLILNAMALGFVMDLDEMLFAFVPPKVRSAVQGAEPLPLGRFCKRLSPSYIRPLFLSVVAGAMALSVNYLFLDVLSRMQLARDTICGGKTSFVYALDPSTGVVLLGDTASSADVNASSCSFRAVLQASDLQLMELAEKLSWDNSWVPDNETMALSTVRELVEVYNFMSSDTAHGFLDCEDLLEDYPYLASIRETTRQKLIGDCSDLVDQCSDYVVRTFCPSTCQCDSLYSGIFERYGCSSSCNDMLLSEIAAIARSLKGIGDESSKCVVQGQDWMERFVTEFQAYLLSEGILFDSGSGITWTHSFRNSFSQETDYSYELQVVEVDLSQWLDISVEEGVCDAVAFLDNFFATDLCDSASSLTLSLGTLDGLCPRACGLCTTGTWSGTSMSAVSLYETQVSAVTSGLFAYNFFEPIARSTYEVSCGSETETTGGYAWNTSFEFVSPTTQYAVFSTCDGPEFDTIISVFGADGNLLGRNDDSDVEGCDSLIQLEVSAEQVLTVVVSAYNTNNGGFFTLSATCGDFVESYTPAPTTTSDGSPSSTSTGDSFSTGGSTSSTSTGDSFITTSSSSTGDSFSTGGSTSSTSAGHAFSTSTDDGFSTGSTTSGGSSTTTLTEHSSTKSTPSSRGGTSSGGNLAVDVTTTIANTTTN